MWLIITKLPSIFHNDDIVSNNKKSYLKSKNINNNETPNINYFNYLNRKVNIILKDNTKIEGILISIQNDHILLNNGSFIKYEDIKSIK